MTTSDIITSAIPQYASNHLLTLAEVATVTGIHPDTVKDWRAAGRWSNTVQDTTGRKPWRGPVTDLVAAGDLDPAQIVEVESTKRFNHPVVGELTFAYEELAITADPGLVLLVYTAEPGSPSAERLRLLASWAAPANSPVSNPTKNR